MATHECLSAGFSEALVSVTDLDTWVSFLETVFRWRLIERGVTQSALHDFWSLPSTSQSEYVLMGDPTAKTRQGRVRLIRFEGIRQVQARPNGYAWDTGGFFDLHVQVRDVQSLFDEMQGLGWRGYTEPQRLDIGGVVVDEVLMQGPDGMAFALIERISPPFQVVDGYQRVSPAWNAPQMVRDFGATYRFYTQSLGFKPTIETEMPPPETGENLFGLPLNVARSTTTQLAFFHPTGERGVMGSVDILSLTGLQGQSFQDRTHIPNLGLVALRFLVKDLGTYMSAISATGTEVKYASSLIDIPPYGTCSLASVCSPEGAVIEFLETVSP